MLIKGPFKVPLRAGYFSDRQITPDPSGTLPRFDGFTAGAGIVLGSVLLDVAYVYEFGKYYVASEAVATGDTGVTAATSTATSQRNALSTNRVFASIIYRFGQP